MMSDKTSLKQAQMVEAISQHKCKQKDVKNNNKEMLTIRTRNVNIKKRVLNANSEVLSEYVIHNDLRGYSKKLKSLWRYWVMHGRVRL